MLHTLFRPHYKLIINPKLKYIHLSINEQGELIVKAPSNAKYQITQLLHKKKVWIEKAQEKFSKKKGKLPTFKEAYSEIYYLGKAYPLEMKASNTLTFSYVNNKFELQYEKLDNKEFLKEIEQFYKEKAQELITPLVKKQAQIMSVTPTAINFRKTKRQWGSCSSKNRLSFNTALIKLPLDVIQYVIVHELAHIRHKHHQKAFWQEVEHYSPNYKELEQHLKEYLT